MKKIYNYILYVGVLSLLLTGCSKEDSGVMNDPQGDSSVTLTFNSILNDLGNRAASNDEFSDIPDCSDAAPATAELEISYPGQSEESKGVITVAILHDDNGYFTDYSADLKIPVPDNGNVSVTLNSFKVYDDMHNLIWAAPVATDEADFAGYVDKPLPFSFDVQDGTKPYIGVDVLCFDRRYANEYGYVFFDIMPKEVYPLCLFLNYCNEAGRHYVANYSVDLYYDYNGDNEVQLYNHMEDDAMPTVGDYNANNNEDPLYYADPLCLVVPGKPANLAATAPYLTLIIYPEDWPGSYGTIDDTPIIYPISWKVIQDHLDMDGSDETTDYLHILIGECEDAYNSGDNTGGGGGTECDLTDPDASCGGNDLLNKCDPSNPNYPNFDCDGDETPNKCDPQAEGYAGMDCDGDGIPNGQDACPNDPTNTCNDVACEIDAPDNGCETDYLNGTTGYTVIDQGTPYFTAANGEDFSNATANVTIAIDENGDIFFSINAKDGYLLTDYAVTIKSDDGSTELCLSGADLTVGGDPDAYGLFDISGGFTYGNFSASAEVNVCPLN